MERQRYLQEFRHGLDESKFSTILQRSSSSALPKTSYHTVKAIRQLSSQEIHLPSAIDSPAVLVVENINLDWIGTLGLQLGLDPAFFVEHAFTLSVDVEPWDAIFGKWSADHRKPTQKSTARYGTAAGPGTHDHDIESRHVDGVIEFDRPRGSKRRRSEEASSGGNTLPRLSVSDEDEIWQTTTRISYCPVRANFLLFLVDAPLTSVREKSSLRRARSQFRVPLGMNRGGLMLPSLFERDEHSLFDCLQQFFTHPWHFHVLFADVQSGKMKLSPDTIFHLVACSTWGANLAFLEREIERTAFEDLRNPNVRMNDSLHDQHRDLRLLTKQVSRTYHWLSPCVKSELKAIKNQLPAAKYIGFLHLVLKEIQREAERLETFLMNTFSLLLSTIGVTEAKSAKQQAKRAEMLTTLAFVYVPLSFVTSIFGMNVREINGSLLPSWVSVVILPMLVFALWYCFLPIDRVGKQEMRGTKRQKQDKRPLAG